MINRENITDKYIQQTISSINTNSICIAVLLSSRLIVQSLPNQLQFNNMIAIVVMMTFLVALIKNKFKMSIKLILVVISIYIMFLITFIFNGVDKNNINYLMQFTLYGLAGLYLMSRPISIIKVYENIIYIYIGIIPFYLIKDFYGDTNTWMGISYSILPGVFAAIIYLTTVKEKKHISMFSILIIGVYTLKILNIFTRGALISVVFFLVMLIIMTITTKKAQKISIIVIIVIVGMYVWLNIINILININNILSSIGVNVRFVDKTLLLLQNDNLLNGRQVFYELSYEGIRSSPIWGNGIGAFETDTGLIYAHNLFLQLAYEGGIIFLIIFCTVGVYFLYNSIIKIKYGVRVGIFICFIFSISIFRLCVSSSYWLEAGFWIFIGIFISINNITFKGFENILSKK